MSIHFAESELADRRKAAAAELARRGLDGLLMFRQESMYYLTGYDTFGYVFFQCLYMGADDETLTLLTRTPDLRQARHTSIVSDIRLWYDAEGVNPAEDLREILEEHGCRGKRLGIETDAYGLTGYNLKRVEAALEGFCELVEASDLVTRLRAVKSEAEISYVREAARLADLGLDRAVEVTEPGAFEGDVLAAVQGAIFAGGGDFPANEVIIGSGPRALLFRYAAGMRRMDPVDQLSLEWAGSYRHYHAAMMRTLCVGEASDYQRRLFSAGREAQEEMTEALAPGRPRRRGRRRPQARAGRRRARGTPLRGVRVLFGHHLQPELDGLADAVLGELRPRGAGDGLLLALHSHGLGSRGSHEPGADLPGDRDG